MRLGLYFVLTLDLLYYIYTQDTNLCTPLLQYGVYETEKKTHKADATDKYKQDFCDSYANYIKKGKSVGVRADIINKFGIGVNNADQEIEELYTLICSNGEVSTTSSEFTDYSSRVLSIEDGDLVHSDASSITISADRGDVIRSFASIFEKSAVEKTLEVIDPKLSHLQSRINALTKKVTKITTDLDKTRIQTGMFTKEMYAVKERYSSWSEYIEFPVKFEHKPELVYGLASFMTWHEDFTMVIIEVTGLTETGFLLNGRPCCAPNGDHGETWLYKVFWVAYLA